MFALNVLIGSTAWRLLYKEEAKANEAYMLATVFGNDNECFSLQDDYGQHLSAKRSAITAVLIEDFALTKMANVELFLHQKRVENMATKAAQADPGLKAAAAMNGPAVLSPMGNYPRN